MTGTMWRQNPQVVARRIGEDMILVPTGRGIVDLQCLFTLNDTGCFIWEELSGPRTAGQLIAALMEEFEVGEEQAKADLDRFLLELANQGCIVEAAALAESSDDTAP